MHIQKGARTRGMYDKNIYLIKIYQWEEIF